MVVVQNTVNLLHLLRARTFLRLLHHPTRLVQRAPTSPQLHMLLPFDRIEPLIGAGHAECLDLLREDTWPTLCFDFEFGIDWFATSLFQEALDCEQTRLNWILTARCCIATTLHQCSRWRCQGWYGISLGRSLRIKLVSAGLKHVNLIPCVALLRHFSVLHL